MKVSLRAAVESFDASQFSDLEYGISDEDAAQGLRDTFKSLGIEWDEDCLFYCGQLTTEAEEAERIVQANKRAEEHAVWAKAHPEEAALQESIERQLTISRMALTDRIVDDMLKPNPFLQHLISHSPTVSGAGQSPNWQSDSDTLTLRVDEDNRG